MKAPLIAILDDEGHIRATLSNALEDVGFRTVSFARVSEFEANLGRVKPDICLIDIGLPDGHGLSLLQRISQKSDMPVIVISGRASVRDRIDGLELGADDYLVKPFDMDELIARIKVVLRRAKNTQLDPLSGRHTVGAFEVNLDDLTLSLNGKHTTLTLAEAKLLRVFLSSPGRLLSREYIMAAVGADENFDRSIDVRISRLRRKLAIKGKTNEVIRTIYGGGYIFSGGRD